MKMTRRRFAAGALAVAAAPAHAQSRPEQGAPRVRLGTPWRSSSVSLEQAINQRRSIRGFKAGGLTERQLGQLLWAAQGITGRDNRRSAPSAGALYPLELSVLCSDVGALASGVYRYAPATHELLAVSRGRSNERLAAAARRQMWIASAPAVICVSAVISRTAAKYGARGHGYVLMEVGAAAENLMLQAVAMGLGSTFVGAIDAGRAKQLFGLAPNETPLCLLPVGIP